MQIVIDMDDQDFDRLVTNSTAWAASWRKQNVVQGNDLSWKRQAEDGRFEHMQKPFEALPSGKWKMAYWLPDDWTAVMFVRAYLAAKGEDYELLFDLGGTYPAELDDRGRVVVPGRSGEFMVLTNYETEARHADLPKEG